VTNGFSARPLVSAAIFVRKEGVATEDCIEQNPRSVIAEKENPA
jgi:hypothetical protein